MCEKVLNNEVKFLVTCDSACDMSKELLNKLGAFVIPFEYSGKINGKDEIFEDTMNQEDYKVFYDNMRNGVVYKTSQINVDRYMDFFKGLKKYNLPILHISLCNALSCTIDNANYVAKELKEEGMDIKVVDSKIASLGIGLLISKACKLRDDGLSIQDAKEIIEDTANKVGVYYTTNTLTYFARGGRLSKTKSVIANALRVNVILDCDKNGSLRTIDKCHGRNKVKKEIIEKIKKNVVDPQNQVLYICASDCKEEATIYAAEIVKEVGFKYYCLTDMGPIIGAHAGPNLMALFFEASEGLR